VSTFCITVSLLHQCWCGKIRSNARCVERARGRATGPESSTDIACDCFRDLSMLALVGRCRSISVDVALAKGVRRLGEVRADGRPSLEPRREDRQEAASAAWLGIRALPRSLADAACGNAATVACPTGMRRWQCDDLRR
jgi:hypothetical protein